MPRDATKFEALMAAVSVGQLLDRAVGVFVLICNHLVQTASINTVTVVGLYRTWLWWLALKCGRAT